MDYEEKWKWYAAVRELTNHIIQGSGADLLKIAMVKIVGEFAKIKLQARIATSTHDSVTIECLDNPEVIEKVKQILTSCMEVKVGNILLPIDVQIKKSFSKNY